MLIVPKKHAGSHRVATKQLSWSVLVTFSAILENKSRAILIITPADCYINGIITKLFLADPFSTDVKQSHSSNKQPKQPFINQNYSSHVLLSKQSAHRYLESATLTRIADHCLSPLKQHSQYVCQIRFSQKKDVFKKGKTLIFREN